MISKYLDNINQRYRLGNATEHTFRGDLQQLIESLIPDVRATNEPKRQKCGAPDYILTKKDIPVGFIEAKDIADKDLEGAKKTGNKEQFDRYKASLNNLIFTDYLQFHLYRDGQFITKIAIAEVTDKGIKPLPENFSQFENLIRNFCSTIGQTIKSSKKLSEMMAGKARLLSDVIEKSLTSDNTNNEDSTLKDQMNAFKQILIHDITPKSFADVYAQTIAYGMFAARYHDPTLPTFSRQEAYELIPKSNPFLKKLFGYIAGLDVDDRIKWIVDDLVNIFLACNVEELLKDYGKGTKMEDPIIHFYEDFLSDYDPALRKARGVWYTPQPVVNFIVRAVDDILKAEFDLPQGLADTGKTTIKVDMQGKKVEQEVHRVQILDPATGTGTFLAETIKLIHKKFAGQQGVWSNYVETHLLPRLNGFELLMASYAMAHLKLDLLLTETGFKPTKDQRFRVYLTNSLEEHHPDTGTLFASWLSSEANEANRIKRDAPVMVIMGNPPYSGESSNKGEWIMNLMEDYKKEPGGKEKLKEQNSKFINDDYVKFLRYGQHFIEKNGSGILAFINPHGFLDNPTFRGMRWNLLKTYDKIYTIDLHGNSNQGEISPDGSADFNVFDIRQGVSVNVFVKTGKKKTNELGKVFHYDLYGKREEKYDYLSNNSLKTTPYKELEPIVPNFFFVNKNNDGKEDYEKGFSPKDLFLKNVLGFQTHRDEYALSYEKQDIVNRAMELRDKNIINDEIYKKYNLKDNRDWSLSKARTIIQKDANWNKNIMLCEYRPFDSRWCYFSYVAMDYPRKELIQHIALKENSVLIVSRQCTTDWRYIFVSNKVIEANLTGTAGRYGAGYAFPLYNYPETNAQQTIGQTNERTPNLNPEIVKQIADKLGLTFTNEKEATEATFAPIDILDYIYAVLHSPTYREKYKEFLKIDFPRVPYPKDAAVFWQLVKLGGEIRQIHLLESPTVEKYITQYPEDGDNVVRKIKFDPTPALPKGEGENTAHGKAVKGSGYITCNPLTYKLIKEYHDYLKANPTEAEKVIWEYLRNKSTGYKIRRQHIIDDFITDFVCLSKKLVIEIDGKIHDFKKEYDELRSFRLNELGYEVIRFTNDEVFANPQGVANSIKKVLDSKADSFVDDDSFTPPLEGTGEVGRVYINDTQYFANVPEVAWNFYIGGYQPAQKWLKDRKDRKLEFEDILHYQKIVVALTETDRLMKEIDKIAIE